MENPEEKSSTNARAIAKGLKKKEMDDFAFQITGFFSVIISCVVGIILKNWFIGTTIFLILAYLGWKKWYKE